jgi:hypothetical protein
MAVAANLMATVLMALQRQAALVVIPREITQQMAKTGNPRHLALHQQSKACLQKVKNLHMSLAVKGLLLSGAW